MAQYNERAAQLLPDVITTVREAIHKRHEIGTTDDQKFADELAQLEAAKAKYEAEIPETIRKQILGMYRAPKVSNALLHQRWIYLETSAEHGFVASDNPVYFFTAIGLGDPQSELAFPISPTICLFLRWDNATVDRFRKVSSEVVNEINNRIIIGADRFIFNTNEASWVYRVKLNRTNARVLRSL